MFSFRSLCDFQFLPVREHPTATSPGETVYEDLVPRLVPTDIESSFSWWTHREPDNQRVPSFLPPFIFSRYTSGVQTKLLIQESEKVPSGSIPAGHGQSNLSFAASRFSHI